MTTVNNRKVSSPSGKDEDPKEKGFFNRPRKGGISIWDWLDLFSKLTIPLVVLGATIWFGWWQGQLADLQHQQDRQSMLDQQRATILQTYIDNIQDLLLNHNLLKSKPTDDVVILARARTLTALQGLDAERKGLLVKFIYEAKLIGFCENCHPDGGRLIEHVAIINLSHAPLSGADLSHAPLSGAILTGADLSRADLSGDDLSSAYLNGVNNLSGANFSGAFLIRAYLIDADLNKANLSGADLTGADLGGAILTGADLIDAIISQEQLDQAYSCKDAILPKGLTCHYQSP